MLTEYDKAWLNRIIEEVVDDTVYRIFSYLDEYYLKLKDEYKNND